MTGEFSYKGRSRYCLRKALLNEIQERRKTIAKAKKIWTQASLKFLKGMEKGEKEIEKFETDYYEILHRKKVNENL